MIDIHHGDVLVGNSDLYIVCRQQLIVSHVILFDPHKCRIAIGLGIAVSFRTADLYLFYVFSQFVRILSQTFILPLLNALMLSFSVYKSLFIELPQYRILLCDFIQVVRDVFRVCGYLLATPG